LTMVDGDGAPIRKPNGDFYTHKLRAGENRNVIAKVLIMEVWRMVHGKTKADASPTGFNRPINYPPSGGRTWRAGCRVCRPACAWPADAICSTKWMISAFSEAGYLVPPPPHRRSCFF
jgi:hypothetical protein